VPELAIFSAKVRAELAMPEKVTSVSLKARNLEALPPKLLECVNLASLDLEDNDKLTDLSGIGTFTKLRKLNLDSCAMSELPSEMRALTELRSLSLRYTKNLAELPEWMSALTKLEEMWITMSALKKIPRVLTKMPALRKLSIWHFFDVKPKVLEGTIAAIGETKLTHVAFIQGSITDLPKDLSPLKSVRVIKVRHLGMSKKDETRFVKAVPHAEMDPKNIQF
jgi:Leucine-rich repeat (LRR) protein